MVDLLAGQHFTAVHFPSVEDLAAQRQDRLELLVPRLLGTAASRIAFHQKQFSTGRILTGAVSQLARQRRALSDLLALDLLARLEPPPGVADGQFGQLQTQLGMGVEPETE